MSFDLKQYFLNLREWLITLSFFIQLGIIFLSGVGLSFIQAPYYQWFLIFPCFGALYFFYSTAKTSGQAFLLGFVFALGYFIFGLHWIGYALLVEGNEYRWAWPLAVLALPALLSLFTALYVAIAHILFPNKKSLSGFLGFCALLGLSEWVRGFAFTGFPWNLYGYGWAGVSEIAQSVSVIGSYGLTLLTILWGCALGFILVNDRVRQGTISLLLLSFIITLQFGLWRLSNADLEYHPNVQFHLIQPNIDQADKWKPELVGQHFETLLNLSIQSKLKSGSPQDIFIWPETAIPNSLVESAAVQERLKNMLLYQAGDSLLSGALVVEKWLEGTRGIGQYQREYHNAILAWQGGDVVPHHIYSKSHLVPFGEYIPFQNHIPLAPIANLEGFTAGRGTQTLKPRGHELSFSPQICYEIIFPQSMVAKGMARPDYILTITNDGWYGNSAGPYQHFTQAQFRAIEQGIPVIRNANTGISGIISPYGRVIAFIPLLQKNVINAALPQALPPSFYSLYGDVLFFLGLGALLLWALLRRKSL